MEGTLGLVALLGATAAALLALLGPPWWRRRQRQRWMQQPFPQEWEAILRRQVPLAARLPPALQERWRRQIQVLVRTVPVIGCQGLTVDDSQRVTIAAQACLLTAGRAELPYPQLRQVLLYPTAFRVRRADASGPGVVQEQVRDLAGESWSEGQVVLSWQDVAASANPSAIQVVLHEFAHQIDHALGLSCNAPHLPAGMDPAAWVQDLQAAWRLHRSRLAWGTPTALDAYGATRLEEFWAVAVELFWQDPAALRRDAPALFAHMVRLLALEPLGAQDAAPSISAEPSAPSRSSG